MKSRVVVWTAALFAVFVMTAVAADVNGKWVGQVPARGGETREATFNFKVDGDKLSGTVSGPQGEMPISDGKVSGDSISFSVLYSFGGNEVKMLFKGTVSGSEIKFTRQREGADRTQEFTVKKVTT